MSLVDLIEQLGAAVSDGLLDQDTAAQRVMELSGGGLTRLGAESALARWRTVRAEYQEIGDRARAGLAAALAAAGESGD